MSLERDDQRQLAPNRRLWLWRSGIVIAIVATLSAGSWWWMAWRAPLYQGQLALNRAYRSQRPFEGRISGFDYAPLVQVRGSGNSNIDSLARAQAERLLLDAAFNRPNPAALHALGRFYLAEKKFKEAGEQFDRALQSAPDDAQLHNDQGVALMEHVRVAGEPEAGAEIEQLARALEHFNKALKLNSALPEARFSRALLYQRMWLPQQAHEEWQRYLKQDTASAWAAEAKRNLQQLAEQQQQAAPAPSLLLQRLLQAQKTSADKEAWNIVNQHSDRVGSLVVHELLNELTAALSKDDAVALKRWQAVLADVGALAQRFTGDCFISDLAVFYQQQAARQRATLLEARTLLQAGQKQFDVTKLEEARSLFARAGSLFNSIGDRGEALQAEYMWAHCQRAKTAMAVRAATHVRLAQVCRKLKYNWLLSETLMAANAVQDGLANHSVVIARSQQGLLLAEANGDPNSMVKFLQQGAVSYLSIGAYHQSLKLYQTALRLINQHPANPLVRWGVYLSIALPLNALGQTAAAAEFQQEALRLAREIGRPGPICRSHLNFAVTCGLRGDYEQAARQAQSAFEVANNLAHGIARKELLVQASLKLGELYIKLRDFNQAATHFETAIGLYAGLDTREAYEYLAHKGRLLAALAQNSNASLEQEIELLLELFERNRGKILEESNRNIFFAGEQDIYDIAIDFWHTRKHDAQTAFELAERSRARSLLDIVTNRPRPVPSAATAKLQPEEVAPPLALAELQARLPAQTQLVQYAVLEDKLLIWTMSQTQSLVSQEKKISSRELEAQVAAYLSLVNKEPTVEGQAAAVAAAQRLYELLIAPIAPWLDQHKELCFVPDKVLNQIPFAALIAPESGRFLIEDYAIFAAPSATMLILCSEAAARKAGIATEKLLSVGNPAFDRKLFPLPYLDSARREAEVVATYYPPALSLTGVSATKQALESGIQRAEVLHLALHCLVNEHSPMHSQLLLASPTTEQAAAGTADGVLQAYEIYQLQLSRLRLVVLAACRSGVERYYKGEGMTGIARPFLAKGIPLVVASLWEVDAEATTNLMINFHSFRKLKQQPTVAALRAAQLSLIQGSNPVYRHPYYWAGFVTFGGQAAF